ncbi:TPA: hypothetical protein IFC15_004679 [Escherichia coli]|nr:hypothetical protein [Escherichia coli]HAN4390495.1 hypothetical protein [Escherichia coli]
MKSINQYRLTPGFGGFNLCHMTPQRAALHAANAALSGPATHSSPVWREHDIK